MTDHDVDIDPEIEDRLRTTFAAVAATSHLSDDALAERQHRRWTAVAAAALALGGLVAIVVAVRPEASGPPASEVPNSVSTSTPAAPTSATAHGLYPLDELDSLEAARRVSLAARIGPTPDESADLAVAGEMLRRDCLRDGGASPPVVTRADHIAVRDQALESLGQRVAWYTSDGIEQIRTDGYFRAILDTEAGQPGPLFLPVADGSIEAQLLADGCGMIDAPLQPGAVEQSLIELTMNSTGGRWTTLALTPQELPEFADQFSAFRDCLANAGYPNYFDRDGGSPFDAFLAEPGVSADELEMANADADCRIATNIPDTYVATVSAVLDEFEREYADELAAVRTERDTALDLARSVLDDHGIDPFTS